MPPEDQEEVTVSAPITTGRITDILSAGVIDTIAGAIPKPTAADAWNSPRKQGFVVQLPSGNLCRVKRLMNMRFMLESGHIPNPLAEHVRKQMDEGASTAELVKMPPEAQRQAAEMMARGVVDMMIEPKVAIPPETDEEGRPVDPEFWNPPPGYISMQDLTMEDRLYLWSVGQGGATDLALFRATQTATVDSLQHGREVPPAASGPNRATRRATKRAR